MKSAVQPTRAENYSEWYLQVIKAADLAEHAPVRGCMVIKPWGYAIWENIQHLLDERFKETGHQNAYFPLFIPLHFLEREAQHVEGFAKECAVVTHHRLEANAEGKLVPSGLLEEPLVVRPTSETMIGEMFAKWITSWRDLPLLINQWANVVRWEMRTRLFLRTTEFLWQEGHTAHAKETEAMEETMRMLRLYEEFAHKELALPVIAGEKSASERFPGALHTYTIEAMTQDRRALQAGTSHFLGQNFAKAFAIKYRDAQGQEELAWTTSWGLTTRLIGALIMAHADDDGLILPPRIASSHLVLIPVIHKEEHRAQVIGACHALAGALRHLTYQHRAVRVIVDERDLHGGEKGWQWIKKGIPMRIEVGPRDIQNDRFGIQRRDRPHRDRTWMSQQELLERLLPLLDEMQENLYQRALQFRNEHTREIDDKEEFYDFFTPKNRNQPEIHGGFALAHWSGEAEVEERIKQELGVTIRCIPLDAKKEAGRCIVSGKKSQGRVVFAKAY